VRLLFLLPSVPDPPDAGAKLRNLGLLRLAATEHAVDAIAFGSGAHVAARLHALAPGSIVVHPPATRARPRRLLDALRSPWPDMGRRLWSERFVAAVRHKLASAPYDVVQAEGIEMAPYLSLARPEQRVYDAHNPETLLQQRAWLAAFERREPMAAVYSRVQWQRLRRFETAVVSGSRRTLAVSYHDANQLQALAPSACGRIHVVPSGIDVGHFAFRQPRADDAPNLLFVGKLDYRPNADAAHWLVKRVLPRLFERIPRARLFMVGANPPDWLVAGGQRDDRLAVTGAVADERPYLTRASVLLLPLDVGAGSRLKALVAMASGVPIASTRLGMEGLDAVPGEHYAPVASLDPELWAATLADLLGDAGARCRLARAGRHLAESGYDWSAVAPALKAAYTDW
jgi:glycosyltransferase involved in cell wall biosynthesis